MPIKITNSNTGNLIHLSICHIFELLFKVNSDLLTKDQHEALRSYFEKYYPQVLDHAEIKKDDLFQLFIKGYDELSHGVNSSAKKFLDCLLIEATNTGVHNALVKLPLNEYMKIRGLKDEKSVRQQVKEDIKALEKIRFEYRENKKGNWLNINLSGGTSGIKNGVIFFRFNEEFFNSFRNKNGSYPFMYISEKIFEINDNNNPHSYNLCKKLHSHKRMNIGKPNEKIISVSALLNACPNIPSYDEVVEKGRQRRV